MRLFEQLTFVSGKLMIDGLSLIGDPLGRLETSPDLVEFSRQLRSKPVQRSKTGVLFSSRFEICSEVLRSPEWLTLPETTGFVNRFIFGELAVSEKIDPLTDSIISKDGEEHSRLRKLIQPAFTNRVMQSWKDKAEKVSSQLVSKIAIRNEPLEFVSGFANPLPIALICEILGVPDSDRTMFSSSGNVLAQLGLDGPRSAEEGRQLSQASGEITQYISELLGKRRKAPEDDLLSALAQAEFEGSKLTNREIVATGAFLLVAGFETTVNLLSVGTSTLISNRQQLELVSRNRDLVPNLVEETLRFVSPVQFTMRSAKSNLVLGDGTQVRKGQNIILMIVGANYDPEVFENPETFIVERGNARRNLAFGFGAHHCIGAALARLEAETAWKQLLERFPRVNEWEVIGEPVKRPGKTIRGLKELNLNFGPASW